MKKLCALLIIVTYAVLITQGMLYAIPSQCAGTISVSTIRSTVGIVRIIETNILESMTTIVEVACLAATAGNSKKAQQHEGADASKCSVVAEISVKPLLRTISSFTPSPHFVLMPRIQQTRPPFILLLMVLTTLYATFSQQCFAMYRPRSDTGLIHIHKIVSLYNSFVSKPSDTCVN
jgi:hypothetical protein